MQNPPWWAVWTRWQNWTLRCEAGLITGDPVAIRWLRFTLLARLALAITAAALIPSRALCDDLSAIETIAYTLLTSYLLVRWALHSLQQAFAFRHGFWRAEDEALRVFADMRRRPWHHGMS